MVIKLFQAKVKLGQGTRVAKTRAIENLYKTGIKTKHEHKGMTKLASELHKSFRKPKQLRRLYFRSKYNIWNPDFIKLPQENDCKLYLQFLTDILIMLGVFL